MIEKILTLTEVSERAGYPVVDGKLNLPASTKEEANETAQALARAALDILGEWSPGDPQMSLTLTGAGPAWAYLRIAHAVHGRVQRLIYAAPNAEVVVFSHGL